MNSRNDERRELEQLMIPSARWQGRLYWPSRAWAFYFLFGLLTLLGSNRMYAQAPEPHLFGTYTNDYWTPLHALFSPDGKTLLITDLDSVVLWDTATRRVRTRLPGSGGNPLQMAAYSPDGKRVATTQSQAVQQWDLQTGKSSVLHRHKSTINRLAFSPDGQLLASGDMSGTVKLWDLRTGKESAGLVGKEYIAGLAFSPDGKMLAASMGTIAVPAFGEVQLWSVDKQKLYKTIPGWTTPPTCVAFSPNGRTLATGGGYDDIVHLWDAKRGDPRISWQPGMLLIKSLAWSPDSRILITSGRSSRNVQADDEEGVGEVRFWEVASGKMILAFRPHETKIYEMSLSPDGCLLAVSSSSKTIKIWDVSAITKKRARALTGNKPDSDARPVQVVRLTSEEFKARWSDLASEDAACAHRSAWNLVQAADEAVAFLEQRLKPVQSPLERSISQLINDLSNNDFNVRDRASRELEDLGDIAEPALRKMLGRPLALEAKQRITVILEGQEKRFRQERLQFLRALAVLEHIGTSQARRLLKSLAAGAPEVRLTEEAKAVLMRFERK